MFFHQLRKISAVALTLLVGTQPLLSAAAESQFWEKRRSLSSQDHLNTQLASLPASVPISINLPSTSATIPVSSNKRNPSFSSQIQAVVDAIPTAHGLIQDVYDARQSKSAPVLLIQDIHLNIEAQNNVAAILQNVIGQVKPQKVGVEGAFSRFDFGPYQRDSNKKVVKDVADAFLHKGYLSAISYVGVTGPTLLDSVVGVDDRTHYDANVQAYLESRDSKKKIEGALLREEKNIASQKPLVFSAPLQRFDSIKMAYHHGTAGLGRYAGELASHSSLQARQFFSLQQFLAAYEIEQSLDFKKVDAERRTVLEKISQKLTENELTQLLSQSLAYRAGRVSFGDYYGQLKSLCANKGVGLGNTPHFENYIRYVLLTDGIKVNDLLADVALVEKTVEASLTTTDAEKQLLAAQSQLLLTQKLIDFSLTPEEWNAYRQTVHRTDLSSFEKFYTEAHIRSEKMFENLQLESREPSRPTVLIVGGFHTPDITLALKEKQIPYVVVSPKLTKVEEGAASSYLSAFAQEKTPIDQLFAGEKLFVCPEIIHTSNPHVGIPLQGGILRAETGKSSVEVMWEGQTVTVDVPSEVTDLNNYSPRVNPKKPLARIFQSFGIHSRSKPKVLVDTQSGLTFDQIYQQIVELNHELATQGPTAGRWFADYLTRDQNIFSSLRAKLQGSKPSNYLIDLVIQQGRVSGYVLYRVKKPQEENAGQVYVDTLAVRPASWKNGVGGSLMQSVFQFAREKNIFDVYLVSSADNNQGREFYRHLPNRAIVAEMLKSVYEKIDDKKTNVISYHFKLKPSSAVEQPRASVGGLILDGRVKSFIRNHVYRYMPDWVYTVFGAPFVEYILVGGSFFFLFGSLSAPSSLIVTWWSFFALLHLLNFSQRLAGKYSLADFPHAVIKLLVASGLSYVGVVNGWQPTDLSAVLLHVLVNFGFLYAAAHPFLTSLVIPIKKFQKEFASQWKRTLQGEKTSLQKIHTFARQPTGQEQGRYISLNWGGDKRQHQSDRFVGKWGVSESRTRNQLRFSARTTDRSFIGLRCHCRSYYRSNGSRQTNRDCHWFYFFFPASSDGIGFRNFDSLEQRVERFRTRRENFGSQCRGYS